MASHSWYSVTNAPTIDVVAKLSNYVAGGEAFFTVPAAAAHTFKFSVNSANTNWVGGVIVSSLSNNAAFAVKCRSVSPATNLWLIGR